MTVNQLTKTRLKPNVSAFIESLQPSNMHFSEISPRPEVEFDGVVHLTERRGGDVADVVAVVHVGRGGGQDSLRKDWTSSVKMS